MSGRQQIWTSLALGMLVFLFICDCIFWVRPVVAAKPSEVADGATASRRARSSTSAPTSFTSTNATAATNASKYFTPPANLAIAPLSGSEDVFKKYSAPATAPLASAPPRPRPQIALDTSRLFRSDNGQAYRVSNVDYLRLSAMKSALDSKQLSLSFEESNVTTLQSEVDTLDSEISRKKRWLDRTSQYEIDTFNRKVRDYNAKIAEARSAVDTYNLSVKSLNREVDASNADLHRVGTPSY